MSLGILLQAAEWLERREREAEHGYAQPLVIAPEDLYAKKQIQKHHHHTHKQRSILPIRTTHNELEKNRRAHLRTCLESLKEIVPLGPESSRHTTLGLLTRAKAFIKKLEESERRYMLMKEQLVREQYQLERRLRRIQQRLALDDCTAAIPTNTSAAPPPPPVSLPVSVPHRYGTASTANHYRNRNHPYLSQQAAAGRGGSGKGTAAGTSSGALGVPTSGGSDAGSSPGHDSNNTNDSADELEDALVESSDSGDDETSLSSSSAESAESNGSDGGLTVSSTATTAPPASHYHGTGSAGVSAAKPEVKVGGSGVVVPVATAS